MLQDVLLYGEDHAPSTPYTVNHEGKGPSWSNSLFEDNAEFGYGMMLGVKQMRNKIAETMQTLLTMDICESAKEAFNAWLEAKRRWRSF